MDRKYWEKIAPDYNNEIFDVLHNDKKAIIRKAINRLGSRHRDVLDAGCAVGKWLPVLSPAFKKVIAADISAKNLAIAKANYQDFSNIEYLRVDMSASNIKLPKVDVVVCINAILTNSMKKRDSFFSNISRCTKKHGHLVLVVPSLESYMFTRIIQDKFKIDKDHVPVIASAPEGLEKYKNSLQGNLDIDSVPTKHYLREELTILLDREGYTIDKFQKIEYSWKTEFNSPPKWLKDPRPWDWMVVGKKL